MPIVGMSELDRRECRAKIAASSRGSRDGTRNCADMEIARRSEGGSQVQVKIGPYAHLVDSGWRPIVCCQEAAARDQARADRLLAGDGLRRQYSTRALRAGGAKANRGMFSGSRGYVRLSGRRAACRSVCGPGRIWLWRGWTCIAGGLALPYSDMRLCGVAGRENADVCAMA